MIFIRNKLHKFEVTCLHKEGKNVIIRSEYAAGQHHIFSVSTLASNSDTFDYLQKMFITFYYFKNNTQKPSILCSALFCFQLFSKTNFIWKKFKFAKKLQKCYKEQPHALHPPFTFASCTVSDHNWIQSSLRPCTQGSCHSHLLPWGQFLIFPLTFTTLTFLKIYKAFCRMFLNAGLSSVSSRSYLIYGFWPGMHRHDILSLLYPINEHMILMCPILCGVKFSTWLRWPLPGFSIGKVHLFRSL